MATPEEIVKQHPELEDVMVERCKGADVWARILVEYSEDEQGAVWKYLFNKHQKNWIAV